MTGVISSIVSWEMVLMVCFLYVFVVVMALMGLCFFLFIEHLFMVVKNTTTIESSNLKISKSKNKNDFVFKNFKQFFGKFWFWFLPIKCVDKFESFLCDDIDFDHDCFDQDSVLKIEANQFWFSSNRIEEIVAKLEVGVVKNDNTIYLVDSFQFKD